MRREAFRLVRLAPIQGSSARPWVRISGAATRASRTLRCRMSLTDDIFRALKQDLTRRPYKLSFASYRTTIAIDLHLCVMFCKPLLYLTSESLA